MSFSYLDNRELRKTNAVKHTREQEQKHSALIRLSAEHSRIYDQGCTFNEVSPVYNETNISVIDSDTVSAIIRTVKDINCGETIYNITALNFASFLHPGGGYLNGSMAQEEAMCSRSFLYNVLSSDSFSEFYRFNRSCKNNGAYLNRAIITPDILFDDKYEASVITCAAPNFSASFKQGIPEHVNDMILGLRIEFLLNCLADYKAHTIILGAWGCGVFMQNPVTVAKYFNENLNGRFKNVFCNVIFAIPGGKNPANLKAFEKEFSYI